MNIRSGMDNVLIVLAAGPVTQDFVSVSNVASPALLPYMGRPLIYQTIINHIKNNSRDVIVAVPATAGRLEEFLLATFADRLNLTIVRIAEGERGTPVTSLLEAVNAGLSKGLSSRPAFIVHGDIYFEPDTATVPTDPTAYVDLFTPSDKYSYFSHSHGPVEYLPAWHQSVESSSDQLFTDVGAYWVPSLESLPSQIEGHSTVGSLLASNYESSLRLERVAVWRDLGHLDTATQIHTRLIGAREFNTLVVDDLRGLLTKKSRKQSKLLNEINYYIHLPASLRIYFPRLFDYHLGSDSSYTLELYSYRTLAEYFVFFDLPSSVWERILKRLLLIHAEFSLLSGEAVSASDVEEFYLGKLLKRIEELGSASRIARLVGASTVHLNGTVLPGWQHYLPIIRAAVSRVGIDHVTSVIHGDLCFSNILYDPQTGLTKLIDPRGAFYEEGCFGDPRYDLAKLLHSFHGGYDFLMQEMYELHADGPGYRLRLFRPSGGEALSRRLLALVEAYSPYPMHDLLILEALLFLSMLPLHSDDEGRQTALYLRGIELLREASIAYMR